MALVKWTRDGYGMLERNRVQTHNIEAQCELDATVFANGAEVGSIVAVNKVTGKIGLSGGILGLLANAERLYDPAHMGLKNYHVEAGEMGVVIFLEKGNTFTTNTLCFDSTAYTDIAAVKAALAAGTAVYGIQEANSGQIQLVPAAGLNGSDGKPLDIALILRAVKSTTMPDGQAAIKFIVEKA